MISQHHVQHGKSWAIAAAALAALGNTTAHAASSLLVWPIDPVMESDQRGTALWIENQSADPAVLQVRVLGWSEAGWKEVYDDQQDRIIGSPPMGTVPPGKRQLIRLIRTADVPAGTETAYRVMIDEIPRPDGAAQQAGGAPSFGVKLHMHYSIPLFVDGKGIWTKEDPAHHRDPASAARPVLHWHIAEDGGQRWLVVGNRGPVHARLTAVAFDTRGTRVDVEHGLMGYVLPGADMRWPLPKGATAGPGTRLVADVNGRADTVLDPDQPGAGQ